MKKNKECLTILVILAMIVTTLIILSVDKWLFETIYYSDMPEWLKYYLLK